MRSRLLALVLLGALTEPAFGAPPDGRATGAVAGKLTAHLATPLEGNVAGFSVHAAAAEPLVGGRYLRIVARMEKARRSHRLVVFLHPPLQESESAHALVFRDDGAVFFVDAFGTADKLDGSLWIATNVRVRVQVRFTDRGVSLQLQWPTRPGQPPVLAGGKLVRGAAPESGLTVYDPAAPREPLLRSHVGERRYEILAGGTRTSVVRRGRTMLDGHFVEARFTGGRGTPASDYVEIEGRDPHEGDLVQWNLSYHGPPVRRSGRARPGGGLIWWYASDERCLYVEERPSDGPIVGWRIGREGRTDRMFATAVGTDLDTSASEMVSVVEERRARETCRRGMHDPCGVLKPPTGRADAKRLLWTLDRLDRRRISPEARLKCSRLQVAAAEVWHGRTSVEAADAWHELALDLHAVGRLDEAEDSARTALRRIRDPGERSFGLSTLGMIILDRGRPAEAIPVLEEALRRFPFDADNPTSAQMHRYLGLAYEQTGDLAKAETSLREALPRYRALAPPAAPVVVAVYVDLARVLRRTNQPEKAAALLAQARAELSLTPEGREFLRAVDRQLSK